MMDEKELQRLRELCARATPGPWEIGVTYTTGGVNDGTWNAPASISPGQCALCWNPSAALVGEKIANLDVDGRAHRCHVHRIVDEDDWGRVWTALGELIVGAYDDYDGGGGVVSTAADAAFIAAARTALPALLEALAQARRALAHLSPELLERGAGYAREIDCERCPAHEGCSRSPGMSLWRCDLDAAALRQAAEEMER